MFFAYFGHIDAPLAFICIHIYRPLSKP